MFGLIGAIAAFPGKRDELVSILTQGSGGMPGCLSYIVAKDASDPDTIWVTEVWDSEESHKASLQQPDVKAAIARGRPLIAAFKSFTKTIPVGGVKA